MIPPTQEDTVLGSRKNTVRVRNITQRVNSLCFSLRSLLFHTVHSKSDNCHAALLSFSLISHPFSLSLAVHTPTLSLFDSLTNRLRIPVYICGSTSWSVSSSAQTFIAKPNMVRNGALTSYSRAPSLINSQRLLGRHTEVSRQPRGTPTFHIRHPAVFKISWLARNASDRQLGKLSTPEHSKTTPFYYMTLHLP